MGKCCGCERASHVRWFRRGLSLLPICLLLVVFGFETWARVLSSFVVGADRQIVPDREKSGAAYCPPTGTYMTWPNKTQSEVVDDGWDWLNDNVYYDVVNFTYVPRGLPPVRRVRRRRRLRVRRQVQTAHPVGEWRRHAAGHDGREHDNLHRCQRVNPATIRMRE